MIAATPHAISKGTRTRAATAESAGPMILWRAMSRAKPSTSSDFKTPATMKVPPTARAQARTTSARSRLTDGSFFSVELEGPVDRLAGEPGDEALERADRQWFVDQKEVLVEDVLEMAAVVPAEGLEHLPGGETNLTARADAEDDLARRRVDLVDLPVHHRLVQDLRRVAVVVVLRAGLRPLAHRAPPSQCHASSSRLLADPLEPAHEAPQRLGDDDRAVGLLIVLQDGDQGPPHGETRTVERVRVLRLPLRLRAVADVGAPRLEVLAVGARGDLPVRVLAGQPDLEVVGLGRREAHVPGAEGDDAVGEPEPLEDLLRIGGELLERLVGRGGLDDLHELDLVELVLSDQSPHVLPVRARLAAEAGRIRRVGERERPRLEDLAPVQVRQGDLGRRDQVEVRVPQLE